MASHLRAPTLKLAIVALNKEDIVIGLMGNLGKHGELTPY